ncbi:MAG: response regulator [Anaerolineae bacterium]|nr:response regulator [Anaerolineae bacterium]
MLNVLENAVFEDKQALIVEDDAHNLLALSSLLGNMKIHYKRNTTGANVLQQARRLRPDFILLDMDLPDGDSFAIYEKLRDDQDLKNTPVIAIADGQIINHLLPRIRAGGFAAYIAKPIPPRDFEALLRGVLH